MFPLALNGPTSHSEICSQWPQMGPPHTLKYALKIETTLFTLKMKTDGDNLLELFTPHGTTTHLIQAPFLYLLSYLPSPHLPGSSPEGQGRGAASFLLWHVALTSSPCSSISAALYNKISVSSAKKTCAALAASTTTDLWPAAFNLQSMSSNLLSRATNLSARLLPSSLCCVTLVGEGCQ